MSPHRPTAYQEIIGRLGPTGFYPAVQIETEGDASWFVCANGHRWASRTPEAGCRTCQEYARYRLAGRPDCIADGCHIPVMCSDQAWENGVRKCKFHWQVDQHDIWDSGPVCLDELLTVMAQYNPGVRWNGWLGDPHFDPWAIEHILTLLNEDQTGETQYTWEWVDTGRPCGCGGQHNSCPTDGPDTYDAVVLVVTDHNDKFECERIDRPYEPTTFECDEDGLYALNFGWIWAEDGTSCLTLVNELPCVRNPEHDGDHDVIKAAY